MDMEYEILHVSGDVAVAGSPSSKVPPPHYPLSHRGSLDLVLAKMAEASQHWEEVGTTIAIEYKELLKEFGLSPLEIQCPGAPRTGEALSPYLPISTPGELPTSTSQRPSYPGWVREDGSCLPLGCPAVSQSSP